MRPLLRVSAMLARMPSPVFSTLDNVTNGTPCFFACSSGFAMTERVTALRITASAPWRSAVWNAFCSCSGEPSVPIVEAVQPRSAAPCLMMSPWISQASTPQLMKTTFFPPGTALPIAVSRPMLVGRVVALWASACASLTSGPPLLAAVPPFGSSSPHPVTATSAAPTASAPTRFLRPWTDIALLLFCRVDWIRRSGGAAALQARHGQRGDENDADEHVPGPLRRVGQREAGHARAEQQDRDDRAAGVEAPVLELGGAEEGGRERGQQVRRARGRRPASEHRREDDAGGPCQPARRHQRHESQPV